MKKVFIVHGWGGSPQGDWYQWLKKELETNGFEVKIPKMPNTDEPEISSWVNYLKEQVGEADAETYFIGHSIGCQTILRYLETLNSNVKIGGAILVAGWVHLLPIILEEEGSEEIVKPWLETPLNWDKIKNHCDNFMALFSDNDPYVPLEDAKIFEEKLNAKIIIEKNKGHFLGEDGSTKIPVILDELLKLSAKIKEFKE